MEDDWILARALEHSYLYIDGTRDALRIFSELGCHVMQKGKTLKSKYLIHSMQLCMRVEQQSKTQNQKNPGRERAQRL